MNDQRMTPPDHQRQVRERRAPHTVGALDIDAVTRADIHPVSARPALMAGNAMARSINAQQISRMQQTHGNAHIQRMIAASRQQSGMVLQRCGGKPCDCSPKEQAKHASEEQAATAQREPQEESEAPEAVEPVAPITGQGEAHEDLAFAGRSRLPRLQGVTRARFNGGSFQTKDVVTEAASECRRCGKRDCVHVTGSVAIDYVVTTTVTLPRVPRNLRPCEQERVQEAIDTILAPHEQQHVDAFNQYNGSVELPLDVTTCRTQLSGIVRRIVQADERPRRAAAKAASAALDPFNFDFDMTCEG